MSQKGTSFERVICKQLSMWWTQNERDDVFWRTSTSGARATTRKKKDKSTFGQDGDVQATDPIGQPLIELCPIEIKKGYSRQSYFDLVDKLHTEKKLWFMKFVKQAKSNRPNSSPIWPWWLLITKRDRKETMIGMPYSLCRKLGASGSNIPKAVPCIRLRWRLEDGTIMRVFVTTASAFFRLVRRKHVLKLLAQIGCPEDMDFSS